MWRECVLLLRGSGGGDRKWGPTLEMNDDDAAVAVAGNIAVRFGLYYCSCSCLLSTTAAAAAAAAAALHHGQRHHDRHCDYWIRHWDRQLLTLT